MGVVTHAHNIIMLTQQMGGHVTADANAITQTILLFA